MALAIGPACTQVRRHRRRGPVNDAIEVGGTALIEHAEAGFRIRYGLVAFTLYGKLARNPYPSLVAIAVVGFGLLISARYQRM